MHFDEKSMFAGHKIEAKTLKEEFRLLIKNISRIMDCSKRSRSFLNLFSEQEIQKLPEHSPSKGLQLTRQEIVALINGFCRMSTIIQQLRSFRLLTENRCPCSFPPELWVEVTSAFISADLSQVCSAF
ncbi:unnamed protein product [Pleuronectes platessa]|uniref:Uncharacterized protein n=1 Tax=Pleuronectes platessa TaxID=8262 RepID=A0A9N7W4T5_PLEPL|nr:unnamed protein product [Pleuronectes platessa]